ncbi:MAG: DUF3037 domain-containing protein [Chloroflexi bacterium]|nr:DUF3037 domain-containing protein [Chloroflexota bacterium]
MNTKTPFQFAVLRYIHDSFTGEFLNVGVAFYCQDTAFFKVRLLQKYSRITNAFPLADGEFYRRYISSLQTKFDKMAEKVNSKQATFESWLPDRIEELLNQILPPDDSSIQFGEVQGGMTDDLEETFEDVYRRLVETHLPNEENESRSDIDVWSIFSKTLREQNVIRYLRPTVIHADSQDIEFEHAWRNGRWKALQPLSFDLIHPGSINKKAWQYFGMDVILQKSKELNILYYLLGKPRREDSAVLKAYAKAKDLLGTGEHAKKIRLIEEHEAEDFARDVAPKIEADTSHEKKK